MEFKCPHCNVEIETEDRIDCDIDYPGYETHTVFVDLISGEFVPLRDDQECRLIKDVEFKYNADNLIEWVE